MKNTNNLDNKNENGINVALDKDDMGDYYDIGNDENEYEQVSELSSEENETSSEDEILPLHSGTDSESSCNDEDNEIGGAFNNDKVEKVTDSDIEEKEDGFPNVKAWGRNVKKFYNTNLIDIKTKFDNEEEELAKLEEIEARTIQQRLLGELEDVDLSLDLIVNVEKTKQLNEENELEEKSKIELDLTALHDVEKYELLKQTCPHLLTYIHDFKKLLNCINDELLSLRFHVMSKRSPVTEFVEIFHQLIMNYCTNVAFFFLIKSHKLDISLHPVMKWISTFEELLKESESIYDKAIKSQNQNGLKFSKKTLKRKRSITINFKPKTMKTTHDEAVRKVADDKGQGQKLPHLYNELLESDGEEKESKRAINYQIAKNKGLTPHRKKELRNPRVKHRMKYRKAKIRRKGQVREARKEIQKYAGEISGIKATVVKSLKFKM